MRKGKSMLLGLAKIIDNPGASVSFSTSVDLSDLCYGVSYPVTDTMSKVLGLAGMRIGYGLACAEIIEYMHRIKPVFSLTRLSFVAALNTFRDKAYIEESIKKGIESNHFSKCKITEE